jgi:hypothetical protein
VNPFFVNNSFPLELIFLFYLQQRLCLCQLECGGGAGSRSPAARGEAAGTGLAADTTDAPGTVVKADTTAAPGTTLVPAIGSSLEPETGIGVSTRSGGLGAAFRASGGLGESMRTGLADRVWCPKLGSESQLGQVDWVRHFGPVD